MATNANDATDRARAPGHAADAHDEPIAGAGSGQGAEDQTVDQPAGNPMVETAQLHGLVPKAADKMTGGDVHRDHFQVDADKMGNLLPAANDEDR
jgi:hypothetical protein